VFHLSILVSVGPQNCSLVWYTSKHGVSHKPVLHSWHLNFVLFSLFLVEHTRHRILLHFIRCDSLIVIQASALPGLPHVIARTGSGPNCWAEDRHKHEPKIKKVMQKSFQHNEHLPLVPYCTNQSSECLNAFLSSPTDCIWTQHPDKPALPQNLNISMPLKPKQIWGNMMTCTVSSKFYSTWSPLTAGATCKEHV
jgi:hypothetical protein